MKKLTLLISVFVASTAMAETVDLDTLSSYEQEVHRYGWCQRAYLSEGQNNQSNLERYQIGNIVLLLASNGFLNADSRRVRDKADNDLEAQLIVGSKIIDQEDLTSCFDDLKDILAKNYVPNFVYMENLND